MNNGGQGSVKGWGGGGVHKQVSGGTGMSGARTSSLSLCFFFLFFFSTLNHMKPKPGGLVSSIYMYI